MVGITISRDAIPPPKAFFCARVFISIDIHVKTMYSAAGEKFFIFTGHIQGIYIDFETSKALFGSFSDHACGFLHENRLIFTTTNNAFLKAFTVKSQKNCRLGGDFFCSKSRTETPP